MENASKALLIAGGILILIILVSLILIVRNNVTDFYTSQDELQMTTDRAKFNEQFTRYNRDDVEGYELISLANKVIDYNERVSSATTDGNNSQAEPISLSITLWNDNEGEKKALNLFSQDNIKLRLLTNKKLIESSSLNKQTTSSLNTILSTVKDIKDAHPKAEVIVKNFSHIFLNLNNKTIDGNVYVKKTNLYRYSQNDQKIIEDNRKEMLNAINSMNTANGYEKYRFNDTDDKTDPEVVYKKYMEFAKYRQDFYKYYEYTQFTKAKFKCTKMDYSSTTGMVTNLEFVFTGEIE